VSKNAEVFAVRQGPLMAESTAPDGLHKAAIEGGRPVPEQRPPPM